MHIIGNIDKKFLAGSSCFLSIVLHMFFLHGKNQQISISRKHKMVNTNRKGTRKGEK